MEIEERLVRLFPARSQMAARYRYRQIRGRLEEEMAWIDRLIPPGRRAIDVGANKGIYTYLLAKHCEHVEAFEPLPDCAEAIRRCAHPRITLHEYGLSDQAGVSTLFLPIHEGRKVDGYATLHKTDAPHAEINIVLRRLDDFEFSDVSFIKIDVEGHELAVINGARETILSEKPVMLIEIEQRHHAGPISEVIHTCIQLGYAGYFVAGKQLQPIESFEPQIHQSSLAANGDLAAYINNFIFIPISDSQRT